ncbi:hypothetical protein Tco_0765190 [Tanacetum coccineum]
MSSYNQRGCFGCGGPLDGLLCRRCTCEWCGNNLRNGFYSICDSGTGNSFVYDPNPNSFNDPLNFFSHPPQPQTYSCELCGNDSHYGFYCPSRIPLDDDEESTIPLNEIISQIPPSIAITPVLPTMEPEDSLNMGDKHLSTILEKESDKVIKSSVEDLVLIPKDIESKDSYVSNLDEEALLVTHHSKLNEDECFDPRGDEIEACLTSDSIPPGIDGADFDPEGDILLLEKLLNDDISFPLLQKELHFEGLKVIKSYILPDFEDDYYDSERDIIYLESLLFKDTIHNLPPEVFLDHNPKSLKDKPDNDDLKTGLRDHPPMLATGRYAQWRSRFLRYINTRPKGYALRKCILKGPYQPTTVTIPAVPTTKNSPEVPE